jgi:hypothetical protein
MPSFSKGAASAKAAAEAASGGGRVSFFRLKSGEAPRYVRFITDLDDLIHVQMHNGVPTRDAPKGATNWPKQMGAVCQNDIAFRLRDAEGEPLDPPQWEDGKGSCYICEFKKDVKGTYGGSVADTRPYVWGLGVERQPVTKDPKSGKFRPAAPDEKISGFADVTETVKTDDGEVRIPKILVFTQGWSNFWGTLSQVTYMTGSVCLTDFRITRQDNAYEFGMGLETPDLKPGTEAWGRYSGALEIRKLTLEDAVLDQASSAYYGRFFDHRVKHEDSDGSQSAGAKDEDAKVSEEDVADVRARMAETFGSSDVFATKS